MLKSVRFENFRNLDSTYVFDQKLNIVFGENNSGKTNILDGIRIAFSSLNNDYCKIKQSDFRDCDDSKPINIFVELEPGSIASLDYLKDGETKCGFKVSITKTSTGRYVRKATLLNGASTDFEIVREDKGVPNLSMIPLVRTEDLYSDGLITGISNFIENEEKYKKLLEDSKQSIKNELGSRVGKFSSFCKKFNQNLDVDLTSPRITDEKAYVVDKDKPGIPSIGSGYKSIATIIINTLNDKHNIVLIDEIENHLHPSVIRSLIRELRGLENCEIIATTHSPVVINEVNVEELISAKGKKLSGLKNAKKLNMFLHPGRAEVVFSENAILVEGYTEEMLLKYYLKDENRNWTIINVAGIMFEPYIELACFLDKKLVVISDNDISLDKDLLASKRFLNLKDLCTKSGVMLIEVWNTLESDLKKNGFLDDCNDLLESSKLHGDIFVAKQNKKTKIATILIEKKKDLSEWHVIKEIKNVFKDN